MTEPNDEAVVHALALGELKGRVRSLEERMTRSETVDTAWRNTVDSTLHDINSNLSQSLGMLHAVKWITVPIIGLLGWLASHLVWPWKP